MMKLYLSLVGYAGRSIRIEQENEMKMLFRYRMLFHPEISPLKLVLFVFGTLL